MDETYMRRALELAELGRGLVSPNPLVGAVVVSGSEIVGEGYHEGAGKPHGEVIAIQAAGNRSRGATLYVTLEPCNHFGRTPPCTDAILSAGIARVVAAIPDPNPAVDGGGMAKLGEGGVEVVSDVLPIEATRQNESFLKFVSTGRPFVTLKLAATLDGKIAARDGSSTWITSDEARADVHRLRGASDAIVAGSGTVLADDPRLTVRDPDYRGTPALRVVADARGRVSNTAGVFDGTAPTLVATTDASDADRRESWASKGADVVICRPGPDGGVDLVDLLAALGGRGIQSALLEGGSTLAFAAVREGIVDKLFLYLAPKLLGGSDAPGILGGKGFTTLQDAREVEITKVDRVGPDLRLEAYVHRDS
ncbi:MAG: bifunctional diaminohydroxyphosphoribosylaminopyrimidine deaminase/5-amino-6-(5-phosphoribosylamino)uracil reductase RibD [Actinomycetota bacterium]